MNYVLTGHAEMRMRTRHIQPAWLERALGEPSLREPDELDPALEHRLVVIPEMGHRVLRVVCRPGSDPLEIVTVHFDRSMKGKL